MVTALRAAQARLRPSPEDLDGRVVRVHGLRKIEVTLGPVELAPGQEHVAGCRLHPWFSWIDHQGLLDEPVRLDPVRILLPRQPDAFLSGLVEVTERKARVRPGEGGIEVAGTLEERPRPSLAIVREYVGEAMPLQEEIVGAHVLRRPAARHRLGLLLDAPGHSGDHPARDFVLDGEHVLE